MKLIVGLLVSCAFAVVFRAGAAPSAASLEAQFRGDCAILFREEKVREEDLSKAIEDIVGGMKALHPSLLSDTPKPEVPGDAKLKAVFAEMVSARGEAPYRAPVFDFYAERWKAGSLAPNQKVIFERILYLLIEDAKGQKREIEPARKRANKAPEPTLGIAQSSQGSEVSKAIAGVAHL